jgi:ubiquinone/menaquinone biosynthesis C-methylase UbiE
MRSSITLKDLAIEYLHDRVAALRELRRVLRPGGALVQRAYLSGSPTTDTFPDHETPKSAPRTTGSVSRLELAHAKCRCHLSYHDLRSLSCRRYPV